MKIEKSPEYKSGKAGKENDERGEDTKTGENQRKG